MNSSNTSVLGDDEPHWKLARYGVTLLLNNRQQEADALFRRYPDSIIMYAGYSISVFMDALMTFEEEKLSLANQVLRDAEKRCCAGSAGWFRARRNTRTPDVDKTGYAEHLEAQIIKADSQMYLATLTFLQQDIAGYFKGAWILRKSWKHYLQTYNEIIALYKDVFGEAPNVELAKDDSDSNEYVSSTVDLHTNVEACNSKAQSEIDVTLAPSESDAQTFAMLHKCISDEGSCDETPEPALVLTRNGYIAKSISTTTTFEHEVAPSGSMTKSRSLHTTLLHYTQTSLSTISSNIHYISSTLNPLQLLGVRRVEMDKATVRRLMCAVSFGYGLLQLGMSLLPPSILRLTNFLGFQGNRVAGLKNLMYARSGCDMRAPMATLALLWYHTIVRPFFALDGNNVEAGADVAARLIENAMHTYADSSIFLFFKGRIERLKCNIPAAINSFKTSMEKSCQREIRMLSQHEVGWCYLIEFDFAQAADTFLYLRGQSRWSRSFYSYVAALSAGACARLHELENLSEFADLFRANIKGSQLDDFLARRFKVCPSTCDAMLQRKPLAWKLLVYDLLYLWNSLPCCTINNLNVVIADCEEVGNSSEGSAFAGLPNLIHGSACCILSDYMTAVEQFRQCLEMRKTRPLHADDAYISAFAMYELGYLLVRDPETKAEGKQYLQQVRNFKDYDFEQRLSVRIHSILKHL